MMKLSKRPPLNSIASSIASIRAAVAIAFVACSILSNLAHDGDHPRRPSSTPPRASFHVQGFQAPNPVACRNHRRRPRAFPPTDRSALDLRTGVSSIRMTGEDDSSSPPPPAPSVNAALVLRNLANQALIGSTIWSGGSGYEVLVATAHLDPLSVLLGVGGAIPLLALSRAIETSESPLVSGLNLSTNMAVMNLFGPRAKPLQAGALSLVLAAGTGIVEETVFRGQLLPVFARDYGNGDIFIGATLSTLLFAVLHTNPLAFFRGREAFIDNGILLILQIINSSAFALMYVLSGNLAVPILAHAVYDFYIFYKTHIVDVAGQMEYAEREALMPTCSSNSVESMWVEKRGEDWLRGARQSFYLMDTNRDGEVSRKELRIALYSYGTYLSKDESEEVKRAADADDSGSIDFDEYLEFVGPTGSRSKAVKYTLLGPT